MAYQAVVRSNLLYCCEAWPVRLDDERMLVVFDDDSTRRILHMKRRDGVPSVELLRRLCLISIPAPLVQRRLCWFSHGGQVKAWVTVGLRVFCCARWRKGYVNVSSELAQDRRAWTA